jgi:pimeloyl-ACP methyl ester carboxylesterase
MIGHSIPPAGQPSGGRPNPDGPPIVLLTGAGYNASAWYPHVAALAAHGPVYGIDMPGDPNPSVARAPVTPPESCAAWLDELLARLGDRPAHLVGTSYGGWVAMNQALQAPERVASLTLLDPAGLTGLDARFWFWLNIRGLASLAPLPLRRRLAGWLDEPNLRERELPALMWAGIRGYRMEPKFPRILTDDELGAITVPVLLATGARSALITPAQARDRAGHIPRVQVEIVPGSHGGFDRIDELNNRIATFISTLSDGDEKQAGRPTLPGSGRDDEVRS